MIEMARNRLEKPSLEARHFEIIARTIAALPDPKTRHDIALHFAAHMHKCNPRFVEERFLTACKLIPL